jgi:hypothetical protein
MKFDHEFFGILVVRVDTRKFRLNRRPPRDIETRNG